MWLFLLWWCVDDTIASAVGAPGLGELPIWVPAILSLAFAWDLGDLAKRRWR